jgi:hypothetical protein
MGELFQDGEDFQGSISRKVRISRRRFSFAER